MVATETPVLYLVFVHLSDDEYQHGRRVNGEWVQDGDNMRKAAREVFAAHPDKPHMVATVLEHGGWSLSFYKDGTIVGTANDTAVLSREAHAIANHLKDAKREYLPEVWRGRD